LASELQQQQLMRDKMLGLGEIKSHLRNDVSKRGPVDLEPTAIKK